MKARLPDALFLNGIGGALRARAGGGKGEGGYLKFGKGGSTGQFLDGAAVEVARREIHVSEIARRPQARIDEADVFEEFCPVDVGDEPQARDDVANGEV